MNTKNKLIQSAIEVLCDDPSSNLNAIAEKAEISRRTIHRYFSSREMMIKECSIEIMNTILEDVQKALNLKGTTLDKLHQMLDDDVSKGLHFEFCQKFSDHFKDEEIQRKFKEMGELFNSVLDDLKQEGAIDNSLSNDWLAYVWMGIVRSTNQALRDGVIAPKSANQLAWTAFSQGVISNDNKK